MYFREQTVLAPSLYPIAEESNLRECFLFLYFFIALRFVPVFGRDLLKCSKVGSIGKASFNINIDLVSR